MLVVEVDVVGLQPPERTLDDLANVVGLAGRFSREARATFDIEPELRGDDDLIADGLQCLTDQLLVGVGSVNLGGVEERHALVESRTDELDGVGAVHGGTKGGTHPHAAETDGRDLEPAAAKCSGLHLRLPMSC